MTYCVALKLNDGLVLASDSRTNAGVDHVSCFRKLHVIQKAHERVIFIQTSGNLATTQSVINVLEHNNKNAERNILNVSSMFEVAELVGKAIREVIARDNGLNQGIDFSCHMLVSGQIKNAEPHLFHVYPEGNFIQATIDTMYFQIGESKYGKPIIDRVIGPEVSLQKGLQCALISMDSTLRSNISVGMPVDVMVYKNDQLYAQDILRIDEDNETFSKLRNTWAQGLKDVFTNLPVFLNLNQ